MLLKWGEILGDLKCVYMRRWILNLGLFTIRLHVFHRSDEDRALHDHPWWFVSLLLWGSYREHTVDGTTPWRRVGSIAFRRATHRHRVEIKPGSKCITFVISGPIRRMWGFWKNGGFWPYKDYFYAFGNPPCKD